MFSLTEAPEDCMSNNAPVPLYPIVYIAIKKHPNISLLSLFSVYIVSRMIMWYVFPQFTGGVAWFPLCRIFEFGLGIYVIQRGLCPSFNSTRVLAFLGVLSFYVYIVHGVFLHVIAQSFQGLALFVVLTLIVACVLYLFDSFVQHLVRKGSVVTRRASAGIRNFRVNRQSLKTPT